MRQLFFLIVLTVLICACNSDKRTKPTSISRTIPEPDIVERLKYQKASIDTLFNHHQDSIQVFVKLTGRTKLLLLKDSVLPEQTEISFYIFRDSLNHIAEITESPYSQSGDWYITLSHYFDKDGKTFAFVRQTNFFNSGCTTGVAYETKTGFYNSDFNLIERDYQLVDEKANQLNSDSCAFPYEQAYKIFPSVDKYMKAYRLPKIL